MFNKFLIECDHCHHYKYSYEAWILKYSFRLNIITTLLIWGNACTCIVKGIHSGVVVEHPSYRTDLIIALILLVLCTTYQVSMGE